MSDVIEVTRVNLGPLRTGTFSRPSSCSVPWIEDYGFYYAQSCSTTVSAAPHIESDTACYPSGWANVAAYAVLRAPFYTASICPSGFASACNVTRDVFDSVPQSLTIGVRADAQLRYLLSDGETGVACCPTGYECHSTFYGSCSSMIWPTKTITGVTYGRSCVVSSTTAVVTTAKGATVLAVMLVYNPSKDNSQSSSNTEGLSTGAKIGIGLAVPLIAIVIGVLIFIYYRRKRKSKQTSYTQSDLVYDPVLPPHLNKNELKGSEVLVTSDVPHGPVREKGELDANQTVSVSRADQTHVSDGQRMANEIGTAEPTTQGRSELDRHPSATIRDISELDAGPYRYELDASNDKS